MTTTNNGNGWEEKLDKILDEIRENGFDAYPANHTEFDYYFNELKDLKAAVEKLITTVVIPQAKREVLEEMLKNRFCTRNWKAYVEQKLKSLTPELPKQ